MPDITIRYGKKESDDEKIVIVQCDNLQETDTLEVACTVPNDTWYFEIVPGKRMGDNDSETLGTVHFGADSFHCNDHISAIQNETLQRCAS